MRFLACCEATVQFILPLFVLKYWHRIQSSPVGARLTHGSFWSLAGAVFARGMGLVSAVFVARVLGKVGFGEFGTISSTIAMFGLLAGLGLGVTATKYVAQYRATDVARAGRIVALSLSVAIVSGIIMTLVLVVFAPWLASKTLGAPHLTFPLQIASGLVLFGAISGAQTGILSGFEAFQAIARLNVLTGIATVLLTVAGVYLGGLNGALYGGVISMGIGMVLNHVVLKAKMSHSNMPFTFVGSLRERKILWDFCIPATISGIMVGPVNWACNAILVNQPNGYAEMGLFSAANQWRTVILFIPGILATVLLPVLSDLHAQNDGPRFQKVLFTNVLLNAAIALAMAIPIALLSSPIMAIYGNGYSGAWPVLVLLAAVPVLSSPANIIGQAIASRGQMWHGFFLNFLWAVAMLLAAHLLKSWGATGLALATLIAYCIHLTFVCIYIRLPLARTARQC